jgi:hypothetical protein
MLKIFIILFFLCANAFAIEKVPTDVANSYKLIGIEKTLIGLAESMMSSQGKMIDAITQFVSSSASSKTLSITYKILKNKNELDIKKMKENIFKQSLPKICENPLSNFLIIEMGATYTFNYYDMSNYFLFQLNYSKNNCVS